MGLIFLVILVVLLLAAVPAWPYSRTWGYGPTGLVALLLLVILLFLLLGWIPWGFGPTVVVR
jgi:hypothetical protein